MERLLILILMVVLLAGCSQSEFMDYKAQYIEEQGISDIEEIEAFEAEPYIEGSIFKGITDGQEYLYYYEGLPGSQKEGTYANGAYTGTVLDVEEGITYDIHKGEDYGYDKSFFIGIAYTEVKDVFYKGESISFKTADVRLNQKDVTLTIWLMPFENGKDISISDFEYR